MTRHFQAGTGPNMNRCHIYETGQELRMSLCGSVNIARNYKADLILNHPAVCRRCVAKFLQLNPKPTAVDLGVSELKV
jgi:hypothetical protein